MNNLNKKNNKGFAVLFLAIMIASITTAFSFMLSTKNIESIKSVRLSKDRIYINNNLDSCLELALMEVRNDPESDMDDSLSVGNESCQYQVSGNIPNKVVSIDILDKTKDITILELYPVIVFE